MKKHLVLLPLLSGLVLSGCQITLFGKTIIIGKKDSDTTGEIQENPNIMKEFGDYKLAKSVKDGGRYLLGNYRVNDETMRFINGDYHRDGNKEFPFYMGTVGGTTNGAAEIEVKMHGDKFSMQVFAPGLPWDQKYIGVYGAKSSYSNFVMSIALLDSPTQTGYAQDGNTYRTKGLFSFYEDYDGIEVYTPGIMIQHPNKDEEETLKFLGTGHNGDDSEPDYISVDCQWAEVASDPASYDLVHFYEHK